MSRTFARLRDQDGATAVEYGIMVALIAVVIISAVYALGQQLQEDYDCVEEYIRETPQGPPSPC